MGLSSKCEQCHVYSRRTRLNTGLFELYFEFEEGIVRGHAPVVHKKRHSRLQKVYFVSAIDVGEMNVAVSLD